VKRWRLKRQLSQLEKPVSEYGHPDGSNAHSDGYGRGRPDAMKNFRHGVLLFVFDTPAMMEVPLPTGCLIRRFRFNHLPICSFALFLTLISNTILRLCPKCMEINKNPRLSVALNAIFSALWGRADPLAGPASPQRNGDIIDAAVSVQVLSIGRRTHLSPPHP
jgi:hypothetical protein